jgi:hypothetical protein
MDDTKRCARCGEAKPLSEFGIDVRMATGRKSYCHACNRAWAKERYERDPDAARARQRARAARRVASGAPRPPSYWPSRLKRYGITPADYERMLAEQAGCCAICGSDQPGGRGVRFHVDHDHDTGRVRSLLCHSCNVGLGHLGGTPESLRRALRYLEEHAAR